MASLSRMGYYLPSSCIVKRLIMLSVRLKKSLKITGIVVLTAIVASCAGSPPNIFIPKQQPPALKMSKRPDVALVLGGGGARGYAHLGVLTILQKAGVPINLIVGASAGSLVGAFYADNDSAQKTKRIMMHAGFWDFADISNVPSLKGPVQGYHVMKFMLRNMRARTFGQLKIPFVVATTDLQTADMIPISSGPVVPAVRASTSVPGAIQPMHLYGYTLIDGGVVDPIPVDIAKKYHPKIIIAVNIANQLSPKTPRTMIGIYDRSSLMSWLKLSEYSQKGADVIIRPAVGHVGIFDLSHKRQLFAEGEQAAYKALPKILKLLKQKHIALLHSNAKRS